MKRRSKFTILTRKDDDSVVTVRNGFIVTSKEKQQFNYFKVKSNTDLMYLMSKYPEYDSPIYKVEKGFKVIKLPQPESRYIL